MSAERDVSAFEARSARYDSGWLGRLHHQVAARAADIAQTYQPQARRILDVGCGTAHLLRVLATRYPNATEIAGVDPARSMIAVGRRATTDVRVALQIGVAEQLPYPADTFDLVVSTTSFDHWADQAAGISECRRVLTADGCVIVVDLFSRLLGPTLVGARRTKARTPQRMNGLLARCGFTPSGWHDVTPLIKGVVATPEIPGHRAAPIRPDDVGRPPAPERPRRVARPSSALRYPPEGIGSGRHAEPWG